MKKYFEISIKLVWNYFEKNILINYIMVEQIYEPKGFNTKFFSKSEKDTVFNFGSSFKRILTNYYEKK